MTNLLSSQSTDAYKRIGFTTVDDADGKTLLNGTFTATVRLVKADGTSAAGAGTITQPDSVNAPGYRYYTPTAGELNVLGQAVLYISGTVNGTTIRARVIPFDVSALNQYDGTRLGMAALPNAAASDSGGLPTVGTGAGQIQVTGSGSVWARVTAMANDVVTAASLAADAADEIADEVATRTLNANVTQWSGAAVAAPSTAGVPKVDVDYWRGTLMNGATLGGYPHVNVEAWDGNSVPPPANLGIPSVDVIRWRGSTPNTLSAQSNIPSDVQDWKGTAVITPQTAGTPDINVRNWLAGTPNALVSGRVDATVGAMQANVVTSTAIASGAITNTKFAAGAIDAAAIANAAIDRATFAQDALDVLGELRHNTAQAGTLNNITLDAGASSQDNFYRYHIVHIVGGTGAGQARVITNYIGATKVASVDSPWSTAPNNTSVFKIVRFGSGFHSGNSLLVGAAVWDEPRASHTLAGTFGERVNANLTHWKDTEPAALAGSANNMVQTSVSEWLSSPVPVPLTPGVPDVNLSTWHGATPASLNGDGFVKANVSSWLDATPNALQSGRVDSYTGEIGSNVINSVADAVWDEPRAGHVTAGTFGEYTNANVERWKTVVPNGTVSGRVDVYTGELAPSVINSSVISPAARPIFGHLRDAFAQGGGTSSITLDAGASSQNSAYVGAVIYIISGTGIGQLRRVIAYDGTTKIATVDRPWDVVPNASSVFYMRIDSATASIDSASAAAVADAVWDEPRADHVAAGSFGERVPANVTHWQGTAPGLLVSSRVPAYVGAMAGGVVNATSVADSAAQKIADSVWDEPLVDHALAGSAGEAISEINADTNDIQARLPDELVSGRIKAHVESMDAGVVSPAAIADAVWDEDRATHTTPGTFGEGIPVGSLATDAISAASVSSAAVTKIQSGLATSSSQTTIQNSISALDTKLGTPQGDSISEDLSSISDKIGTPTGSSLSADIAAVKGDTASTLSQTSAIASDVNNLEKVALGRWKIEGSQLILYEADGVTPFRTFNLLDDTGAPSGVRIFERVPV